jgi:hypothetical protein
MIIAPLGLALLLAGCSKKSSSSDTSSSDTAPDADGGPLSQIAQAKNRTQSANNLKQICFAYASYTLTYRDKFPDPAVFDPQGRPLLSWRVTILPFIEQQDLWAQFHMNEPWDSEHNKKLIPQMPKTYLLPGKGTEKEGITYYRIFVADPTDDKIGGGDMPLFRWKPPYCLYTFGNVPDGVSNTILVAEAEDGVPWTKPEELVYNPKKPVPKLGFRWNGKGLVGMADSSVIAVDKNISEETLRHAITPADGHVLGSDWDPDRPPQRPR